MHFQDSTLGRCPSSWFTLVCYGGGFPGLSISSHPVPGALKVGKWILSCKLTIGKTHKDKKQPVRPGGSVLESEVLKYWPFQIVNFYSHALIFTFLCVIQSSDSWFCNGLMITCGTWYWDICKVSIKTDFSFSPFLLVTFHCWDQILDRNSLT